VFECALGRDKWEVGLLVWGVYEGSTEVGELVWGVYEGSTVLSNEEIMIWIVYE